nr:Protein of unknown function DUF607 domain containing protein [Haemonchus contortus]
MKRIGVLCVARLSLFDASPSQLSIPSAVARKRHLVKRSLRSYCSDKAPSTLPAAHSTITVRFERGLPLLDVVLPSRQELCQFSLRPLTDDVGSFCDQLHREDRGLDYVAVYTNDGVRVATSTSIEHLLQFDGFRLRLNDHYYDVVVPQRASAYELDSDRIRQIDDLKATVASLHAALCVDEYKVGRERRLIQQLEKAETELRPLHEVDHFSFYF